GDGKRYRDAAPAGAAFGGLRHRLHSPADADDPHFARQTKNRCGKASRASGRAGSREGVATGSRKNETAAAVWQLLRLGAWRLDDGGADYGRLAAADHGQLGRIPEPQETETAAQLRRVPNRRSSEVRHYVAGLETGEVRRRARIDFGDDRRGRRRG